MTSPKVESKKQVAINNGVSVHQRTTAKTTMPLLTSTSTQNDDLMGLQVERGKLGGEEPSKQVNNIQIIEVYLQSGRKIVIEKLSDGRSVRKYYSADGKILKPDYFKKVEGDVKVSPDGESYTVTKDGQIKTYQTKIGAEVKIAQEQARLNKEKKQQGFIGKSWDWMKNNVLTVCDGSNKAQAQIDAEKNLLKQIQNGKISKSYFKEVTGLDCTQENIQKFKNGKLNLKSTEKISAFTEGQETAVDITSDIVSGVVAYGTAAACIAGGIAAAPFTAGASLGAVAVGVGIAAGAGAITKVGIKKAEAAVGGKEYSWKQAGKDATIGAVSGALAPVTLGVGGAITKSLGKGFAATSLRLAAEGGTFGAADGATRSALNGDSIGEIGLNTVIGAGAGALAGNLFGHGGKWIGKTFKKIINKLDFNNFNIIKIFKTKKIKKKILNSSIRSVKNKQDLKTLEKMLDDLIKSDFDLSLIREEHLYHNFIRVTKCAQNQEQFEKALVNVLTNNKDNVYVIRTLSELLDSANYTIGNSRLEQIQADDIIKLIYAINESKISPKHLFSILNRGNNSELALLQGDPCYLRNQANLCSKDWDTLAKMLPTLAKMEPKSQTCLFATRLAQFSNNIMRVHQARPREKKILLQILEKFPNEQLEQLQKNGIDLISLRNYLKFYNQETNVNVSAAILKDNYGKVFGKKAESTINSSYLSDFISQHKTSGIPLSYTRQNYIRDLNAYLMTLNETDRNMLLKQMVISVTDSDINGIIAPNKIQIETFAPEVRTIIKEIKLISEKFVSRNHIKCENQEIKTFIESLTSICPEFMSMIGKPIKNSDKTLDTYVLEVFNNIVTSPKYKYLKLSDVDKYVLKLSAVFHALGQTTDVTDINLQYKLSAKMAKSVMKKYNLDQEVEERVLNLISNGGFWNTNDTNARKFFRTLPDYTIAEILTDETTKARGIEGFDMDNYLIKGNFVSQVNYAVKNPRAKIMYPKYKYTVDGKTYEIPVLDVRNMSPETDMTQYGYIGMKLKDITVQIHHTAKGNLRDIYECYQDPNYYDAFATTIRNIANCQNGYGNVGYVFSTSKMNKGGGDLFWKKAGVGDLDNFCKQSGLSGGSHIHAKYHYPTQIKDPEIKLGWFNITQKASKTSVNEVFALKPLPEQIELNRIDCTAENIPIEYIKISVENDCMPILLTN